MDIAFNNIYFLNKYCQRNILQLGVVKICISFFEYILEKKISSISFIRKPIKNIYIFRPLCLIAIHLGIHIKIRIIILEVTYMLLFKK